ncbi:MAG: hypothetical protein JW809_01825 [Pirellulales bacterium]|nr:hypothetical protein [Pirellulales bacterium]
MPTGYYHFWLNLAALVATNLTGLAAVWVALGRGHWFVRAAALGAWAGMWLLVPAHEITAIIVVESLVVVPPLMLARQARTRAPGGPLVQYTIRDLLLVAVLVAVVAAAGSTAPAKTWTTLEWFLDPKIVPAWCFIVGNGAISGALVLFAAWVALGRTQPAIRLGALAAVVAILLVMLRLWLINPPPGTPVTARLIVTPDGAWLDIVPLVLGLPVLPAMTLAIVAALGRPRAGAEEGRGIGRRVWRAALAGLLVLIGVALVVPSLGLFYALMTPPAMPDEPPPPEPNGYDTLVRIGGQLANVNVPYTNDTRPLGQPFGPDAFRAFRRQYDPLLSEARAALDQPCRVRVTFDPRSLGDSPQRVRQLCRALDAAGRAAAFDGEHAAAVGYHLDTVRLGRQAGRGGILVDWLVGVAIEGVGLASLHNERASLDEPLRRDAIRRLTQLQGQRESVDTCWQRNKAWEVKTYGWQGRLFQAFEWCEGGAMFDTVQRAGNRADAKLRILLAELALAGYREMHGQWPATLDALVPEWLDAVPKDHFRDGPLVYQRTDQGYELYSVGANGRDDGRRSYLANDPEGDDVWFW